MLQSVFLKKKKQYYSWTNFGKFAICLDNICLFYKVYFTDHSQFNICHYTHIIMLYTERRRVSIPVIYVAKVRKFVDSLFRNYSNR